MGPNSRVFPTGAGNKEDSSTSQIFDHSLSYYQEKSPPFVDSPTESLSPFIKYQFPCSSPVKTSVFCYHCCCAIFILTLYSLYTLVILILISINVQCLQNVVFSFEKGSNSQDHSSSDSHNPIKVSFIAKFLIALTWENSHLPLNTIW